MNIKHLIRSFVVIKCLETAGMGWIFSTYMLFLLDRGLTPQQATQANIAYMTVNFFFDLPTGAIADVFGQVPIYLLGLLVLGTGLTLYGFGSSLSYFVFCESTSAVGTSLMSKALESHLTNIIGVEESKIVRSQAGVYSRFATIPTALVGSMVAFNYGLEIPWFCAGVTMFIAFVYGTIVLRKYHTKPANNVNSIPEHLKMVLDKIKVGSLLILTKSETRLVVIISGIVAFATQATNMFWAPIIEQQSGETWWFGLFWIGISLTTALGAYLARNLKVNKKNMALMLLLIGLPLLLIGLLPKYIVLTVVLFLTHEVGRGALPIILEVYLNRFIPDDQRSTATSAEGSIERLFRAAGLWFSGVLTNHMSLTDTWTVSGLILIVAIFWVLKRKERS